MPGAGLVDTEEEWKEAMLGCLQYFMNLWNERAKEPPKNDFISRLVHGEATKDMPPMEYLGNLLLLAGSASQEHGHEDGCDTSAEIRHHPATIKYGSRGMLHPRELTRWARITMRRGLPILMTALGVVAVALLLTLPASTHLLFRATHRTTTSEHLHTDALAVAEAEQAASEAREDQ